MSTENILYLALIKGSLPIFETKFLVEGMDMDSSLFSGTLTAIQMLSQQVSNRDIQIIDQGDLKIIIEHGNHLFGVVLTSGESEGIRIKLKQTVTTFENEYSEFLQSSSLLNVNDFLEFKKVILHIFSDEIVKPHFIPFFSQNKPSDLISPDYWSLITLIDGKRNISEIIKQSNLDSELATEIIGDLNANGLIKFKIIINLYDITNLTPNGNQMLLNKDMKKYFESNYGSGWFNVIKSVDGQKTLKLISNIANMDLIKYKKLITDVLGKGYLEILSDNLQRVIVLEELYKEYYKAVKKLFGKKGDNYFNESLKKQPNSYVELIIIESNETFSFERIKSFFESGSKEDSELVFENLLIPIKNLNDTIESILGKKQKLKKREEIMMTLEEKYGEKIEFIRKFYYQVD
ncbi:MAG: hypothetical protein ACW981_02435 [Candidatus Hodarchaeales archaeon]|jgi:predicted transcriptional regulator